MASLVGGCPHVCLPLADLARRPDIPNFVQCEARAASSHQFVARVASLSRGLGAVILGQPQPHPDGAVVMIAAQNTDAMLQALLAVCDAGCIATPINTRWSATELAAAMQLTQPAAVMADAHCARLVADAIQLAAGVLTSPMHVALGSPTTSDAPSTTIHVEALVQDGPAAPQTPCLQLRTPRSGAAMVCFTSGTTGQPKGVVLSHGAFNAQSLAKLAVVGYSAADVYLHLAPLFHIGGLSSALACIMAGARHVLLPRVTPAAALRCLAETGVTTFIAVPAIMQDLVSAAEPGTTFPGVRKVLMGGGVTTAGLQEGMSTLLPAADFVSAYGMTEACSSMTFLPLAIGRRAAARPAGLPPAASQLPEHLRVGSACAGWPAPGVALRVAPLGSSPGAALDTGAVGPFVEGHVHTRGPHTCLGYWADPEATSKAFLPDGWLRTGDVGFFDAAGALWLRGRANDMIKSGGENVYATEVEVALCRHPGVSAAAVVGLPHTRLGETVAALVVLRPGVRWAGPGGAGSSTAGNVLVKHGESSSCLDSTALQHFCRHVVQLSPYKLPRLIAVAPALPVNASGKVVKPDVKAALLNIFTATPPDLPRSRL